MLIESPFFSTLSITHSFRTINFSDTADKTRHDRRLALVTQMLESTSILMVRNGFREESTRVLRVQGNDYPLPDKTESPTEHFAVHHCMY